MTSVGMHTVATASQNARLGFMHSIMRLFFQGVNTRRSADWRNIPTALKIPRQGSERYALISSVDSQRSILPVNLGSLPVFSRLAPVKRDRESKPPSCRKG
jgi:hypothetical protein